MKKLFNIYDKDEENQYKERLMKYSNIPEEYLKFQLIYYNENNKDEYVHTVIVDDPNFENKDTLVMLHGLAGSSVIFYQMFKILSSNYKIVGIDLPGMGCSSRNEVTYPTFNSAVDYFCDRLKSVFDKLGLENFTLLGHSFGGYVSGLFTIKYPNYAKKIIFLSPVGIANHFTKISTSPLEDVMTQVLYKLGGPPTIGFKFFGFFANVAFTQIMQDKCKNITNQKEKQTFINLMNCFFRNVCVSEKTLFSFFDSNCRAFNPLINHYKKFSNKKIMFIYGDKDWSPISHAESLRELIPSVRIEIAPNCGHLMYSDDVVWVSKKIIEFEYDSNKIEENPNSDKIDVNEEKKC